MALLFKQGMAQEVDLSQYILGYWGTSEDSFEKAETSGEYIEVTEDGNMRFFELTDDGEQTRMEFTWVIEEGVLKLYTEGELVIEATIDIVEEGRMIWTNQDDQQLYLIVGAG